LMVGGHFFSRHQKMFAPFSRAAVIDCVPGLTPAVSRRKRPELDDISIRNRSICRISF